MEKFEEITGGSALLLPLREGLFDVGKKYELKNGKGCIAVVLAGVLLVAYGMQLEWGRSIPETVVYTAEKGSGNLCGKCRRQWNKGRDSGRNFKDRDDTGNTPCLLMKLYRKKKWLFQK